MKLIVVAGGQGTKLWPMSRESKPKQFQQILPDSTLFKYQIDILRRSYEVKDIFVSTKERYVKYVMKDFPDIPKENLVVEPDFKKNRGPGEGYAILKLSVMYPDEPFMIVQSDCIRIPETKFLDMIVAAEKLVRQDKKFISGGQKAMFVDMGSDYLKLGKSVLKENGIEAYSVDEFLFRGKNYEETKLLIENFHVTTHCNHNCWYPNLMLEAYERYRPDWYESLIKIRDSFGKSNERELTDKIYSEMAEGATEEVTQHVFPEGNCIIVPYKWTDVGTWESVYEYFSKRGENYKDGDIVDVDTQSSLIKGKNGKLIAVMGLKDVVVVDTDDVLLVTRKDKSGDIKKILDELKKSNPQYL